MALCQDRVLRNGKYCQLTSHRSWAGADVRTVRKLTSLSFASRERGPRTNARAKAWHVTRAQAPSISKIKLSLSAMWVTTSNGVTFESICSTVWASASSVTNVLFLLVLFPRVAAAFIVPFVSRIKRNVAAKVGTPAAPRLERFKLVHDVRGQCFVVGFLGTYGDARGKAMCVMGWLVS